VEITIADIVKEFGEAAALRGVSLQVRAGELMALLGPSGSGKTTLLRVIAGLEIPDAGHVLFGGEDATGLPVQKRQVGFVFQHYALFKHLSVFDNIAYGLRARERKRRPSEGEIRKRVLALLDLVQLAGIDKRFPLQLSGGQRQRVALARALAVEPRVLLLDEPFGALDAKVRKDLRRWLRDIHDRTGQTTVFVTHDQDEALELADRVAILCNGRVEQVGPPEIVYDQPSSPFVMSFVGETARLPVTVVGGEARLAGKPIGVIVRGVKDGPTDLFLRPWEIAIGPEHPGRLNGIVKTMRRSGQKNRLAVLVEATDVLLDIDVPLESAAKTGDVVSIQILRGRVFPDRAKGGAR
jgi:sulfate transport system ATP-binding protein